MSEYGATSHQRRYQSQKEVEKTKIKTKEKRKFELPHVLLMMLT